MKKGALSSAQIRAARALLRWSAADLARESALGANTIRRAEVAEEGTSLTAANELAIRRALAVGVPCIEHGHLMDEETAKLMADKGVWLSTQPFLSEEDTGRLTGQSRLNALQMFAGTNTLYPLAKEHKIKTAFGSDLLFSSDLATRQGVMLTHLRRWYENVDILRMATSVNGELLALSGPRNPYHGKLGVVEKYALADLLVVNGDPITIGRLLGHPHGNACASPAKRRDASKISGGHPCWFEG